LITVDKNEHSWVQASFNGELIHKKKIFSGAIQILFAGFAGCKKPCRL